MCLRYLIFLQTYVQTWTSNHKWTQYRVVVVRKLLMEYASGRVVASYGTSWKHVSQRLTRKSWQRGRSLRYLKVILCMYTQHTTSCFSILLVYYAGVNWIFTALLSNYVGVNVCTGCLVFCIYMPVKNKIAKNPSFFEGTCCLKNSI